VLLRDEDRNVEVGQASASVTDASSRTTRRLVRSFLAFEAATFAIAALVHAGGPSDLDWPAEAATEEAIIAIALLVGLGLSWSGMLSVTTVGIVAQAFALFGMLVGIVTLGVGDRSGSAPDVVYQLAISAVLIVGLVVVSRRLR